MYLIQLLPMELVRIYPEIYEPIYDSEENVYKDKCPFQPRSRNNVPYECRCKLDGKFFTTKSQFDLHCKSRLHQNFLENYERYFRDSDESQREIKDLKIQNGILDKKIRELHHKLDVSHKYLQKERDNVKHLQNILHEFENKDIYVSEDDEFQDCD